jgi:hypothetical protein
MCDDCEKVVEKIEELNKDISYLTDVVEMIKEKMENESLQSEQYDEKWDTENKI